MNNGPYHARGPKNTGAGFIPVRINRTAASVKPMAASLMFMAADKLPPYMVILSVVVLLATACKTPPAKTALNVETLISEGNCAEIQARLTGADLAPNEKGALAVCALVHDQRPAARQNALNYIAGDDATETLHSAASTLSLAVLYPSPTADFQLAVVQTVLGASGYGPLTSGSGSVIAPKTAEGQQLAIHLLHYAVDAYFNSTTGARLDDLVALWSGCQHLLGSTYTADNDYLAWQLFTALAELGLNVFDPFNKTEFGYAIMKATITALEQNGAIAVAAKCDLGSPYERLKQALSKDTALLGPMERAVSVATGCSRGKYAPQEQ